MPTALRARTPLYTCGPLFRVRITRNREGTRHVTMSMITRRNYPRFGSSGWRQLARQSTRAALRAYQSRKSRPTREQRSAARVASATDNPLTTQHDFKIDYRRRKRTRKLRRRIRRGRKFTKRVVNSYLRTMQSPKQVVRHHLYTRIAPINSSYYFSAMLHSADGVYDGDNPQADWREWFIEGSAQNRRGWDELGFPLAPPAYPFISERGRAIRCNSSTMDLTIRNTGTTSAILNVYRIVCKRDWPFSTQTVESIYEQGFRYSGLVTEHDQPVETSGPPLGAWDNHIRPEMPAATPFQSFLFTKLFNIYRRTKYQLAPGEEINLQLKSNRPRIVSMEKVRNKTVVRGLTHGYFVDFQGVPVFDGETEETSLTTAQLSVQRVVRYSLTMMPSKRPATSSDIPDPDPTAVAVAQLGSVEQTQSEAR